jgi:hypothetical protein
MENHRRTRRRTPHCVQNFEVALQTESRLKITIHHVNVAYLFLDARYR